MFLQSLVAGETCAGADSYDAGMIPTPTLARAAKDFNCGVMITASHNPPDYNGVKLWNPDGSAFNTNQMDAVEEKINDRWHTAVWDAVGNLSSFEGAIDSHIESISKSLSESSSNVILDCGCGATSVVSPVVLRSLGCKLTTLNAQPDGYFPGRSSEPTEDQLHNLRDLVLKERADLGIAHDGDGDRMVALDEKGNFVSGDRLVALFASWMNPESIAVPVDASMVIDELVKKVYRCKVGDVFIAEVLKNEGAEFGGEPSGTYIFPEETYCPDGIFAGALLSNIASETKISEYLDNIPQYPIFRSSYYFEKSSRPEVSRRLKSEMESLDCDSLTTIDGYRADFSDGWFLVRISGTEPKLRLVAESKDEETMWKLRSEAEKIMWRCIS